MKLSDFVTVARKATVAASGAAAEAVAAGLLSGEPERWTTGVLAVATAFLTYMIPNAKAKPDEAVTRPSAGTL